MDSPVQILARLKQREARWWVKVAGLLALGAVLSLIAPALVSFLFWSAYNLWGHAAAWGWFFLAFCVLLIPFLFRLEVIAQGDYLGRAAREFDPQGTMPGRTVLVSFSQVGMIAAARANERAAVSGFIELFLLGPRLVVTAWRQIRLRRLSRDADRMRAARVLETLAAAPSHVRPQTLLKDNEQEPAIARVLAYLLFFDWIGIAHDGGKVWLLTEARDVLGAPESTDAAPTAAP